MPKIKKKTDKKAKSVSWHHLLLEPFSRSLGASTAMTSMNANTYLFLQVLDLLNPAPDGILVAAADIPQALLQILNLEEK